MSKLGVAVTKTSCATKDPLRRAAGQAWHALLIGVESLSAHHPNSNICCSAASAEAQSFQRLPVSPLHLAAARRRAASCWSESVQSLGGVAYSRLPWCRLTQADFLGARNVSSQATLCDSKPK
jgi:hypothetical protein